MKRVPEPILLNDRKKRRPLAQGSGGGGGESEVRLESERQGVWKAKGKGGQGGGGGAGESEVRILRGTQLNKFLILLNPEVAQLNNFLILVCICPFLATSPCDKANGIACCNRAANIACRRMYYPLICKLLQWTINYLHSPNPQLAALMLMLADLADVLGMN